MFKMLAVPAAVCVLLAFGCEKKVEDPIAKIPTTAPSAAKGPGDVLEHLQYSIIRKDPAHLKAFVPPDNSLALGTTQWFHKDAGYYGLGLTSDEINALGVQPLVEAGYISDKFTSRSFNDAREGKRDLEPGMELVNEYKLDMPVLPNSLGEKKIKDLNKQLSDALEKDIPAAYAAGLYRRLKAIPDEGWAMLRATLGSNPNKDYKDLVLKAGDEIIVTITVGEGDNGTVYITAFQHEKSPRKLAELFPKPQAAGETKEAPKQ